MKARRITLFAALLAGAVSALLFANAVDAQTYTWDPLQQGGSDGPGDWDSASDNWASSGSTGLTWLDSSDAVFGSLNGTAGTVTVTTQVTPNSITFSPAGSGNYVISGGSINLLNTTTPINVNTDATISSPFVGSGGLSVAGFGTLTVTGSNTYSGPTLVTGGTLNIAGGGSLNNAMSINTQGGGLLSINSGVVTMASGSTSFGIGCGLNGTTGTTTINSGVLNIGGSNGFTTIGGDFPSADGSGLTGQWGTGVFNINGGLVNVGPGGGSGPGSADASRLWFNAYYTNNGDPNSGPGSMLNLNGGTLSTARPIANGGNAKTVNFNFNGGVLQAAADIPDILDNLHSLGIDPNGPFYKLTVYVQQGGATIDTNGHDTTIDFALLDGGGGGGLTKIGDGTLTLASSSSYTGPTSVNRGILQLNVTNAIGSSTSITVNDGGTLVAVADDALGSSPELCATSLTIDKGGTLLAAGQKHTSMVYALSVVGGTISSQGTGDAYGNFLLVGSGYPNYTSNYHFSSASDGTPATLSADQINLWNGNSPGAGDVPFNVTKGGGPVDLVVSGNLMNFDSTSGLTKLGNGVMLLSGSNTYAGGTTVNGGVLQLGNSAAVPDNTPLTVISGTLDLGNFMKTTTAAVSFQGGVTQNGVIVNNGPDYDGQAGTVSASLQGTAGLTKTGSGTLVLSGPNTYGGGTTVDAGTLTVSSSTALPDGTSLIVGAGGTFIFDPLAAGAATVVSSPAYVVTAVPEPGTLLLLIAALGSVECARRVRRLRRPSKGIGNPGLRV